MSSSTLRNEAQSGAVVAQSPALAPGRLATLAFVAGAVGALPVPVVPEALRARVRGAVVHDVASRHGLALTDDARRALVEPLEISGGGALRTAVSFIARRGLARLGAFGVVGPVAAWAEVWALGHLFDRYLTKRGPGAARVDVVEAERVRRVIDRAQKRVVALDLAVAKPVSPAAPTDDLRDDATRVLDTVLLGVATLPAHARARLEAAFDEALREDDGAPRG